MASLVILHVGQYVHSVEECCDQVVCENFLHIVWEGPGVFFEDLANLGRECLSVFRRSVLPQQPSSILSQ
jgi:hypothetical protein